eukprot:66678_1
MAPTIYDYYQYNNTGTVCPHLNDEINWQGPAPFANKTNVALQFFAFGDTPYDASCSDCNTCIAANGTVEQDCSRFDCILKNITISKLPADNTCTYEGPEYECVRDNLIPYMNEQIDAGEASFIAHAGDIIKGTGLGGNLRCTPYSFASRKNLFSTGDNLLLVPGDNDWNECFGYNISSNTDPTRELWREYFAGDASPLGQFSKNFPSTLDFDGKSFPLIDRKVDTNNPEIFYFLHNKVAFFGLNAVRGGKYLSRTTINEDWVEDRLGLDQGCTIESIVLLSQFMPEQTIFDRVDQYFEGCGEVDLPILTITGEHHPGIYCLTRSSNNRFDLTIEAFRSGPVKVSVVRDPSGVRGDYFQVEDTQVGSGNYACPRFA